MKHWILTGLAFFTGIVVLMAQSSKQVSWNYSAKKISDGVFEIHMTATVAGDYHIYSQTLGVDGPIPTSFKFTKNPLLVLDGKVKEQGKAIKKLETVWNGNVTYYEKTVDFVQVVKIKGKAKTNVSGVAEFMVCNEKQCLPPSEVTFKVDLGG
jgi:hypothetical protein